MSSPGSPTDFLRQAAQVHRRPGAVVCGATELSYPELLAYCQQYARGLQHLGLQPGQPVAFTKGNSLELFAAYFAVPMAGGGLVPIHPGLSPTEKQWMLQDCDARQWIDPEVPLLPGPELPPVDPTTPAMIFYSSGTQARPTRSTFSHAKLAAHGKAVAQMSEDVSARTDLHMVGLFHANGWGFPHACTLLGSTQIIAPRFAAQEVMQILNTQKVTHTYMVPTMGRRLLQEPNTEGKGALRQLLLGGEVTPEPLLAALEARFACEVHGGYGLTEAGPTVANAKECAARASLGRPLPEVQTRIAADGELWINSPYQSLECGTDWVATGDLVKQDADGTLHFVGRTKQIIVRGGENISAAQVELAISQHPLVAECVVTAVADPHWGESVHAVLVLRNGASLALAELQQFLRPTLARFQLPTSIELRIEPLPHTATGKLRRQQFV